MGNLRLQPLNPVVCRVLTNQGEHVGNLKLIGPVWKFKAIGYDHQGGVMAGGGPLTHRHNMVFVALDETEVNARLGAA